MSGMVNEGLIDFFTRQGQLTPEEAKVLKGMLDKGKKIQTPSKGAEGQIKINFEEFFSKKHRKPVLEYIKSRVEDEKEIEELVKLMERYETDYEEMRREEREVERSKAYEEAKRSLVSKAENSNPLSKGAERIFTREDIGAMSDDEFLRNEKAIMSQLKNGLIK